MSDSVAKRSPDVEAMLPDWQLASALMAGTKAMRAAGQTYLPKFPQETAEMYRIRLATATLFPAYQHTVETLAAKPFSKEITLNENIDADIEEWLDDADLQGRDLSAFAGSLMEDALSHGMAGFLVEAPKAQDSPRPLSIAEERAAGVRPYFVQIKPEQVLGWKAQRINNKWELTQFRFTEVVDEEDPTDRFAMIRVEQVRVLEPGRWEIWRKKKDLQTGREMWMPHEEGASSIKRIPYVPIYGKRLGFMMARPPMLELAYLNVKHWQSQSDQDTILHVARIPILTRIGMAAKYDNDGNLVKEELVIGSGAAIDLPAGASLQYVEHSGQAIGAGNESLQALVEQMSQSGGELLVKPTVRKTATEVATDNASGLSYLQRITKDMEDAIEYGLSMMAEYAKKPFDPEVKLFTDFGAETLAEASAQVLVSMATAGKLSDETLFKEMQRRGIISGDVDFEDERGRIDSQGPPPGAPGTVPGRPGKPAAKPAGTGATPPGED